MYEKTPINQSGMSPCRRQVLEIFNHAINAVNGQTVVAAYLRQFSTHQPVYVVAIGKAAQSMALGAETVLQDLIMGGLVVTKTGHVDLHRVKQNVFRYIEAAHPVPDESSLKAGQAVLDFIDAAPQDAAFLFLISGGASSLVEVLPVGVHLHDLDKVTTWLLGSGLDISAVNAVRKSLSCIKGGRLAGTLRGRQTTVLVISDVPSDDLSTIGSGLLVPDINSKDQLGHLDLPGWIADMLDKAPAFADATDPCFNNIATQILANNQMAQAAATEEGQKFGYSVFQHNDLIEGDVREVGKALAEQLIDGAPGLYIWGGETTVHLPEKPGRGGRSQSLALEVAMALQNHENICFLGAGTDGTDGPTDDAGAVVDGGTIRRGELDGLNAAQCLHNADAGTFLQASGDLIQTGPTGTNVMDLMIGLKLENK
jgi:glycerate 2-kinase